MNRALARRRLLAWDRYAARYGAQWPEMRISAGRAGGKWWSRARRHRTTHAGIVALREGRAR